MKKTLATVLLVTGFMPWPLAAKGRTLRIVIEGVNLSGPVEITDPKILNNFNVWTGPGVQVRDQTTYPEGFIIRWHQGMTAEPLKELPQYQVSFYTTDRQGPSYVVYYRYEPLTKSGYVYLPARTEEWYRLNTSSILHGVEGDWLMLRPCGTTLRNHLS
jgi:hypothetical protein